MAHILLVEDNELNRDMLWRRLTRHGHRVSLALDGQGALQAAQSQNPQIIIMDLRLPDMNGREVTRLLKAGEQTRHIPVLALTAHAMESDRAEALRAGCDDFDVKPVDFPRLLAKIEALVERK